LKKPFHAGDQEQTMMSSCALAGVDLNPQLQHKASKTDKSVTDQFDINCFITGYPPCSPLPACVYVCDSKTFEFARGGYDQ